MFAIKLLEKANCFENHLLFLYIDDVYAVFDSDSACTQFLDIFSSHHKDTKFTLETKNLREFAFSRCANKLNEVWYDTCVWRKPTNTSLLLNFNAL